ITPTSPAELAAAAAAAAAAFGTWSRTPRERRAAALEAIASALDAAAAGLVETAALETGLGRPRLTGEVARTTAQLRMFAGVPREGSYLDVIITPADRERNQPDVRRMLRPIGPVAVFSASNFPFAFSVAGGDTASALAAGCSVVVKAHEGHPNTSAQVGDVVRRALADVGAPDGTLQVVYGVPAGADLVRQPAIRAVGFTGSTTGGRALFDIAAGRPDPIPFFGELGSINPVVVLPSAARSRADEIAAGYATSVTLGAGQFCTKPGLVFVPADDALLTAISAAAGGTVAGPLLTERIYEGFRSALADGVWAGLRLLAKGSSEGAWGVQPEIRLASLDEFMAHRDVLIEERFGPAGLVVTYSDEPELFAALAELPGSLTASLHAADDESLLAGRVAEVLAPNAGRLIMNGWPTGVAVCWAMQHGGPWPASTSPAHTSVGATAISRWLSPVAYQDWPPSLLPDELCDDNPLNIPRITR
ncbi:MAG: hypothetical protein QOH14_3174, partial [Pseudonocardiales bacterium]|nr:hypothetical protein [Pseudonocardiales bacterium]